MLKSLRIFSLEFRCNEAVENCFDTWKKLHECSRICFKFGNVTGCLDHAVKAFGIGTGAYLNCYRLYTYIQPNGFCFCFFVLWFATAII